MPDIALSVLDLVPISEGSTIADGHIAQDCDPAVETDLLLALTGFTTLLDLHVIEPHDALTAIDQHLERLFTCGSDDPHSE